MACDGGDCFWLCVDWLVPVRDMGCEELREVLRAWDGWMGGCAMVMVMWRGRLEAGDGWWWVLGGAGEVMEEGGVRWLVVVAELMVGL